MRCILTYLDKQLGQLRSAGGLNRVFNLRTETYTPTLGLRTDWQTYWLTQWLICPNNALNNLAKVEKLYSGHTRGGNNLDHVYLKVDMNIAVKNQAHLSTVITVRTWWESPTRWENKILTKSQAKA